MQARRFTIIGDNLSQLEFSLDGLISGLEVRVLAPSGATISGPGRIPTERCMQRINNLLAKALRAITGPWASLYRKRCEKKESVWLSTLDL